MSFLYKEKLMRLKALEKRQLWYENSTAQLPLIVPLFHSPPDPFNRAESSIGFRCFVIPLASSRFSNIEIAIIIVWYFRFDIFGCCSFTLIQKFEYQSPVTLLFFHCVHYGLQTFWELQHTFIEFSSDTPIMQLLKRFIHVPPLPYFVKLMFARTQFEQNRACLLWLQLFDVEASVSS